MMATAAVVFFFGFFDRFVIAFLRRRANEAPEALEDRRRRDGKLPIHPLAGERSGS
jgi:hypothetical protein